MEKALAKQPGVQIASVNFATTPAHVAFRSQAVSLAELEAAVEGIGYQIAPVAAQIADAEDAHAHDERQWRWRVLLALPLSLAVLALSLLLMDVAWARWTATFGGNIIETGTDSYRLAQTRARAEQHLAGCASPGLLAAQSAKRKLVGELSSPSPRLGVIIAV